MYDVCVCVHIYIYIDTNYVYIYIYIYMYIHIHTRTSLYNHPKVLCITSHRAAKLMDDDDPLVPIVCIYIYIYI